MLSFPKLGVEPCSALFALSLLIGVPSGSLAQAATLLGTHDNQYGQTILSSIDPSSGQFNDFALVYTAPADHPGYHTFGQFDLSGLTYGNGMLYGTHDNQYGQTILSSIDPKSGQFNDLSLLYTAPADHPGYHTFGQFDLSGLTYGNGMLYGTHDNQYGQTILSSIDPNSGQFNDLSLLYTAPADHPGYHTFGQFDLSGLTYGNGTLYGTHDNQYGQTILSSIDPNSGHFNDFALVYTAPADHPGYHTFGQFDLSGLTYGDGTLYGTHDNQYGQTILSSVDPNTGRFNDLSLLYTAPTDHPGYHTFGQFDLSGLSYVPTPGSGITPTPLPGSLALFGMALLGLCFPYALKHARHQTLFRGRVNQTPLEPDLCALDADGGALITHRVC